MSKPAIVSIRLTEEENAALEYVTGDGKRSDVMKNNTMAAIMAEYQARVFVGHCAHAHKQTQACWECLQVDDWCASCRATVRGTE